MPALNLLNPNKVHQFSSITYGGAGIAAIRISQALQDTGMEVRFWHAENTARLPQFSSSPLHFAKPNRHLYAWQKKRHLASLKKASKVFDFSMPWSFNRPRFDPVVHGDAPIHLHWVGYDFFDYEAFFESVPDNHPIVWTLHDINPLTGGCHLAGSCKGFTQACGHCPLIAHPAEHDMTRRAMDIKLHVLKGKNLHFVGVSQWMADKARESSVGKLAKSIRTIHTPLDLQAFSPFDQADARRALGIQEGIPVIAFGANKTGETHKGIQHLVQALIALKDEVKFQLVVFGYDLPRELAASGIPFKHVGFISHQPFQRLIYACADFYALPSLEESLGQMGTEAMACGTPLVAFDTGGIPDYVKHGETGLLAPSGDTAALTARIREALTTPDLMRKMRPAARAMAVDLFYPQRQAEKYWELYEEICGCQ